MKLTQLPTNRERFECIFANTKNKTSENEYEHLMEYMRRCSNCTRDYVSLCGTELFENNGIHSGIWNGQMIFLFNA